MSVALSFDEVAELASRLTRATANGRMPWEPINDYEFRGIVGDAVIYIKSLDDDDAHPYQLAVLQGPQALAVEESRFLEGLVSGDKLTTALEELYQAAKKSALGLDAAVAKLFAQLDQLDPPF